MRESKNKRVKPKGGMKRMVGGEMTRRGGEKQKTTRAALANEKNRRKRAWRCGAAELRNWARGRVGRDQWRGRLLHCSSSPPLHHPPFSSSKRKKNINEEEDRFLTRVWTSALFFSLSPKRIRLIVANYTKASSAR